MRRREWHTVSKGRGRAGYERWVNIGKGIRRWAEVGTKPLGQC